MPLFVVIVAVLFGAPAHAAFWNPPSTVDRVRIGNFHFVLRLPSATGGEIYRGAQPAGRERDALELGITDILILKNETWNEVRREERRWLELGYPQSRVRHVPFRWRNSEEETACRQMMEGFEFADLALREPGAKLYVHCTAGEDRTGVFVALTRMMLEGQSLEAAFAEMCAHGFADANRWKPRVIVRQVNEGLVPLLAKFATWIQNGELRWGRPRPDLCGRIAQTEPLRDPARLRCR